MTTRARNRTRTRAAAVRAQNVNSCAGIVAASDRLPYGSAASVRAGRREPCAAVHRCEHACLRLPSCCLSRSPRPGPRAGRRADRDRGRRPRRAVALRPGAQGLRRHGAQPHVEGLVHGRRRRAERRLLPDQRHDRNETLQYVVTDGATFTDLQTRDMTYTVQRARRPRADVPRHGDGEERPLPDRHRLPHRPRPPDRAPALALPGAARRGPRLPPLRPLRPDAQRQRRRRATATAAPTAATSRPPAATRCSSARTRSRRRTRPTATTRSPSSARWTPRARSRRCPTASPGRRATA